MYLLILLLMTIWIFMVLDIVNAAMINILGHSSGGSVHFCGIWGGVKFLCQLLLLRLLRSFAYSVPFTRRHLYKTY